LGSGTWNVGTIAGGQGISVVAPMASLGIDRRLMPDEDAHDIAAWLQKDLKPFVDQYLDTGFIERQGIFNNEEVQRIRQAFYNGKTERAEKIWFLLMFQMWYDRWMNNN
ncbi:MAG TPA: peptidase dimerization domain-containing protein, partial [Ferruginibacter sp.]|nr:peptidase dimerization domain-containing protein [Ferruginibacter sp.]